MTNQSSQKESCAKRKSKAWILVALLSIALMGTTFTIGIIHNMYESTDKMQITIAHLTITAQIDPRSAMTVTLAASMAPSFGPTPPPKPIEPPPSCYPAGGCNPK